MSDKIIPIDKRKKSKNDFDVTVTQDDETKRVCVDFGKQAIEKLASFKQEVGATSYSEVIRDALRLYIWAIEQQKEGFSVQSVKKEGKVTRTRDMLLPL